MKELERFEADPSRYRPGGGSEDPIYLDANLTAEILAQAAQVDVSPDWRRRQRSSGPGATS